MPLIQTEPEKFFSWMTQHKFELFCVGSIPTKTVRDMRRKLEKTKEMTKVNQNVTKIKKTKIKKLLQKISTMPDKAVSPEIK
jgi:glycerol-3-phosphate cytidylyltransferase-like family protein